MKKNLILSAVGIGLQTVGSICLIAAALGIGKEINQQIKKLLSANYLGSRYRKPHASTSTEILRGRCGGFYTAFAPPLTKKNLSLRFKNFLRQLQTNSRHL